MTGREGILVYHGWNNELLFWRDDLSCLHSFNGSGSCSYLDMSIKLHGLILMQHI